MLLNDNVPAKETEEPEITKNRGMRNEEEEETTVQEKNLSVGDEESTQDDSTEKDNLPAQEENTQVAMEVDQQQSTDNIEKKVENGGIENESGDLDIESMLAAIHNVNPPEDGEDAQNVA